MRAALLLEDGALFRDAAKASGTLDVFDPRSRLLCALGFALAVSAMKEGAALLCASVIPLALLFCGPLPLRALLRLNGAALIMAALLALTWPDVREGMRMGLLLLLRLNLIFIALWRLVIAMGPGEIDAALTRLGLPERLRLLLLLTQRGAGLLAERLETSLRALCLRAPRLVGTLKLKAFASVAASSLVQGADRSERMVMALRCRGGLKGFAQTRVLTWRWRDTALCLSFALTLATAFALS